MKHLKYLLGAALVCQGLPAQAQTEPVVDAHIHKYSTVRTLPVKAYQGFPVKCRPALQRAVAIYNAQRSRLAFSHNPSITSSNSLETTRDSDVVISYTSLAGGVAATIVKTRDTARTPSADTPAGPNYYVTDTDVLFNMNTLFNYTGSIPEAQGQYYCPAAAGQDVPSDGSGNVYTDKVDMETILLHELTHAAGLSHREDQYCVMYRGVFPGDWKRAYCPAEAQYLRNLYGTLP